MILLLFMMSVRTRVGLHTPAGSSVGSVVHKTKTAETLLVNVVSDILISCTFLRNTELVLNQLSRTLC